MLDLDTITKIGALIGVVTGVKTAAENLSAMRHKKLKEDYELAKAFLSEGFDEMNKEFVAERGFQALAGTSGIKGAEARQLIALDSSGTLLRAYKQARDFIEVDQQDSNLIFKYRSKYLKKQSRRLHQLFWAMIFITGAIGVIGSILLPVLLINQGPDPNTSTFIIGLLGYTTLALFAIRKGEGMTKAAEIVNSQAEVQR
jgi:hypothetical protein